MSRFLLQVPLLVALVLSFFVLFQISVGRVVDFDLGGRTFQTNITTLLSPQPVTEPTTLMLLGLGLVGVAAYIRRQFPHVNSAESRRVATRLRWRERPEDRSSLALPPQVADSQGIQHKRHAGWCSSRP